jgi:sigma-B regulation protein RsbU (phosphoserine phosphatase)
MDTFESARVEALVESARLLQSARDVHQLLTHLLREAMAHALTRRAFVAFDDGAGMRVVQARGLPPELAEAAYDEAALRAAGIETIFPIGPADLPTGLLGVGAPAGGRLTNEQEQFLGALTGISAGAVENVRYSTDVRRLNLALDRRVQELRTLLDLVRDFTAVTDPEEVARMLALTLAGQWAVQRSAVAAWREGQPDVLRCSRGVTLPPAGVVRTLAAEAGEWQRSAEISDAGMRDSLVAQKIAALVPIRTGPAVIGLVALGERPGKSDYSDEDLQYTRGLVDQAAVALENAWNFRETLEKKKIEKELELAADIQRRLLPAAMPVIEGLDVAAATRPARHVGGDYYDILPLPGGEQLCCVADVSGKGIAASLLMSNFQASLRAFASAGLPLGDVATRMNALMHASTAANKYVTAIFLAVNPASRECRVVNAGHNDGVLLRADGSVERWKAAGLAIGLMAGRTYTATESRLGPGDVVVLYSDGVTEANDPAENEYGIERLIELMREHAAWDAAALVDAIYRSVDAFAGTAPQYDDITAMVIRCR